MLDLFRNREKATRYLLTAVLSIVAISMVITLIPGITNPGTSQQDDQSLAKICNATVTVQDVRRQIEDFTRGGQLPQNMVATYVPTIVEGQIELQGLACAAQEKGFEIADQDMANEIRNAMPSLVNPAGEFDRNAYEANLTRMGLSVPVFEERLKQQILVKRMQDLALEGLVVPDADVRKEFERRNVKLKVQYAVVSNASIQAEIHPSEADLEAVFKNSGFRNDEKRQFTVVYADQNKIAEGIKVSDDELKMAYQKDPDRWRVPERIKLRHILVMTQGKPETEKPNLLKKAQDVLAKAKSGADFAKLAKEYSEDPGSKDKGGEYDWMPRGQFVPAFESAAFALKQNEISNVVTTEYGYHIIQSLGHEEAHLKPIEEVRPGLVAEVMKDQVQTAMQKAIDAARAEAVKTPGTIDQIAAKYNLGMFSTPLVVARQAMPVFGNAPEFNNAIFALKQGEFTSVTQPTPTTLAFARLDGIQPARPSTFAERHDEVVKDYMQVETNKRAQEKIRTAKAKIEAGADFVTVAKALGAEPKTSSEIGRDGAIEGLGESAQFADLFSKPEGAVVGPISVMGQWVIARSVERREPSDTQFANEKVTIVDGLKKKMQRERYELFRDSIMQHLLNEGKIKRNQNAINRLINAYRT
jgi:peptidyl-prolyl cis-trans isomerase D